MTVCPPFLLLGCPGHIHKYETDRKRTSEPLIDIAYSTYEYSTSTPIGDPATSQSRPPSPWKFFLQHPKACSNAMAVLENQRRRHAHARHRAHPRQRPQHHGTQGRPPDADALRSRSRNLDHHHRQAQRHLYYVEVSFLYIASACPSTTSQLYLPISLTVLTVYRAGCSLFPSSPSGRLRTPSNFAMYTQPR